MEDTLHSTLSLFKTIQTINMSNYSIQPKTITLSDGDSVSGGQINSSQQLVIVPNSGYVVAASDFSFDNTPANADVDSVTFEDSGTPYSLSNTVLVNITLASAVSISTADRTVNVDVDGEAILDPSSSYDAGSDVTPDAANGDTSVFVDVEFDIDLDTDAGITDTITIVSGVSSWDNANKKLTVTSAEANKAIEVATWTTAAGGGKELVSGASASLVRNLELLHGGSISFDIKLKNTTLGSNDEVTERVYSIIMNSSKSYSSYSGIKLSLEAESRDVSLPADEINSISVGKTTVRYVGESRTITVYGRSGSKFDLDIHVHDDAADRLPGFPKTAVEIKSSGDRDTYGYYECEAVFPQQKDGSENWHVDLDTTSYSTSLWDGTNSNTTTLYQLEDITVHVETSSDDHDGAGYDLPTSDHFNVEAPANSFWNNISGNKDITASPRAVKFTVSPSSGYSLSKLADPDISMFSDSNAGTNGDTRLRIGNATTTISGNDAVIEFDLIFDKFGSNDVRFKLDLDQVIDATST